MKHSLTIPAVISKWFESQGWLPFDYQIDCWAAYNAGKNGMIRADTGMGKTYAAMLGPIVEYLNTASSKKSSSTGLQVLWITPLRALAKDTEAAISTVCQDLGLPWTVVLRTGDTKASVKQKLNKQLPEVLITTPESLSLLLSYPNRKPQLENLKMVVVDEWHELMGTKRGVQAELGLCRLRRWAPQMKTWGISATLGNLSEATTALMGSSLSLEQTQIVEGPESRSIEVLSVLPDTAERFPWAGHLGTQLVEQVADHIAERKTSLVFTNTRSQAEQWYQHLLQHRPEWAGQIAVHHGSLDPEVRRWVDTQLSEGTLRAVVCTSSLDLGIDFPEVEQVFQIGSPKGIGRLIQRAGRSGHRPSQSSRLVFVPTHAFELIEITAAKQAISQRKIERRHTIRQPLDVLAQHVVTLACGDGFCADELYSEVTSSHAFKDLTRDQWEWVLDFDRRGGTTLEAYPDYQRIIEKEGRWVVASPAIARRQRMSIGTISSDAMLRVKYMKGGYLGSVEESFLGRLKPEDPFIIAGKVVELVRIQDMTAYVRRSKRKRWNVPRWMGGKLPISSELGNQVRLEIGQASRGEGEALDIDPLLPLLQLQDDWSVIPAQDELLIEQFHTRDGYYTVAFPFEGRAVHEGLAALWAYRLSRDEKATYGLIVNDYAVALHSPEPIPRERFQVEVLAGTQDLPSDIVQCLNLSQMARQQFRDIARIAGLVFGGFPGRVKSSKQLQASSNLFFDVFQQYDPDNLLLHQARQEVLDHQLNWQRLITSLDELARRTWRWVELDRPTPFSFPLVVERMRDRVSSEKLAERVKKMQMALEKKSRSPQAPSTQSQVSHAPKR
jgi:ATP-dependent Lhr-like helicase